MRKSILFLNLVFILLVSPVIGIQAQNLFLSIAGESATFKSGDSRHQYDIWIKPETEANRAYLQIYDAGINGDIDQITTTNANTATTFRLFKFDDLYWKDGNQVIKKGDTVPALDTLIARDENLYKKRWVNFSEISNEADNGFILRVNTDNGSDVNNYNLRVIDESEVQLNNESWNIIAIDLGIGIFNMSPEQTLQLKPYTPSVKLPKLQISGEEDSKIEFVDALGYTFSPDSASGTILQNRFGVRKSMGSYH